jgi:type II secretory pathway component PulJ
MVQNDLRWVKLKVVLKKLSLYFRKTRSAHDQLRTQTKNPIINARRPLNTCNRAISLLKRHSGQPIKPQSKHAGAANIRKHRAGDRQQTSHVYSDWLLPMSHRVENKLEFVYPEARAGENSHTPEQERQRVLHWHMNNLLSVLRVLNNKLYIACMAGKQTKQCGGSNEVV